MIESPSLPPGAELQSEPLPLPDRSFGRVARSVLGYSLLVALMFVTALVVFVPAALMHSAVRNGRAATWIALLIAIVLGVAYVAGPPVMPRDLELMAWSYLTALVLAVALPTMAALPLVERRETFGRVLLFLLIAAAVGLAATEIGMVALTSYSPYAGQLAKAKVLGAEWITLYRSQGMPSDVMRMMERAIDYTLLVLPGGMMIELTFVFVLSLLMIGRLKAWRDHVARRSEAEPPAPYLFRNLMLPEWLLFGFVLGGLTPIATGMLQKVAANVLAVVVFLYVLQGLAIFRYMLVAVGAGIGTTVLGWTLLVLLTFTAFIGPLLLGLAGLFDPFFDFRQFKKRKDDSHESHSD